MNDTVVSKEYDIQPDLGDQRQSTYKALPAPPITPKRVLHKYRFSIIFPFILAVAAFVLTLVVVLAGQQDGTLDSSYLIAINTTKLGQDIVRFERANAQPANTPGNVVNGLLGILEPFIGNVTDTANKGINEALEDITHTALKKAGVKDMYYLHLQRICSTSVQKDGSVARTCEDYDTASQRLSSIAHTIPTSFVVGPTNITFPILSKLMTGLDSTASTLTSARKAILAFFIISLAASALSAISAVPAIIFPRSRLLIYFNLLWSWLASTFALLAALIITAVVVGISAIAGGVGGVLGLGVEKGGMVLLFVWLASVFVGAVSVYWLVVWFVEVRTWSFVRRVREKDQIGNWRGVKKEVWRDLRGKKVE